MSKLFSPGLNPVARASVPAFLVLCAALAACADLGVLDSEDDGSQIEYPACFDLSSLTSEQAARFHEAASHWIVKSGYAFFGTSSPACPHSVFIVPKDSLGDLAGLTSIQNGIATITVEDGQHPTWERATFEHEQGHVLGLRFPSNPKDPLHSDSYALMAGPDVGHSPHALYADIKAARERANSLR